MSIDNLKAEYLTLKQNEPKKPKRIQILLDDTTPEATASVQSSSGGNAALSSDEGGTILSGRGFQNISSLSKDWSGSKKIISRKTSPSFTVNNPRLTISLMAQPAAMEKFMKRKGEESLGIGFIARFLV